MTTCLSGWIWPSCQASGRYYKLPTLCTSKVRVKNKKELKRKRQHGYFNQGELIRRFAFLFPLVFLPPAYLRLVTMAVTSNQQPISALDLVLLGISITLSISLFTVCSDAYLPPISLSTIICSGDSSEN